MIDSLLDWCKISVKRLVRPIALTLNRLSGGRLTPDAITITGLLMHLPIAVLIARGNTVWAGGLLIVFGLFDTLDGELARLQGTSSPAGMFLDSVVDRIKEVILYVGIAYFLLNHTSLTFTPHVAMLVVAAVGGSIVTSYINAWGDAVSATHSNKKHAANQTFRGGLMRFEVRMALLVVGLLSGWLLQAVALIAVLAWITALSRMQSVIRRLA
jgi:phosphatidylglycerophosphate synthase